MAYLSVYLSLVYEEEEEEEDSGAAVEGCSSMKTWLIRLLMRWVDRWLT